LINITTKGALSLRALMRVDARQLCEHNI